MSKIKVEGTRVTFPAIAEYAKIFPKNMETPEGTKDPKIKKALEQTKGKYTLNAHLPSEEVLQELKEAGISIGDGQMSKKLYPSDLYNGVGFIKVVRLGEKLVKTKTGDEFDIGGAPKVYKRAEDGGLTPWDYEVDGKIGNGSEVLVKVEVYNGSPRLEAVLVKEHVKFSGKSSEEQDAESFSI